MKRSQEDVVCVITDQGPILRYKNVCDNSGMSVAGYCPGCENDLLVDENVFLDGNNKCPQCNARIGRGWRFAMMHAF